VAVEGATAIDCNTATPVPLSAADCGLLIALSDTVSTPPRAPAAVGEKVTVTEQDDPLDPVAASVAGGTGQVLVCEKSPVVWIEVIDRGTG
jgi:hypothetical protein